MSAEADEDSVPSIDDYVSNLGKGSSLALGGRLFNKGMRFFLQLLLAQFLAVALYGLYTLGYVILKITYRTAMLGFNNGVIKQISENVAIEDINASHRVALTGLCIPVILSVVVSGVIYSNSSTIADILTKPALAEILSLFALTLPLYTLAQMISHVLQGYSDIRAMVIVRYICLPFTYVLFLLVAIQQNTGITGVIVAFGGSALVTASVGLYFLSQAGFRVSASIVPTVDEITSLVKYSVPLYLSGFIYVLMTNIDFLMLGRFVQAATVGQYRASVQLATIFTLVLGSTNAALSPAISSLHTQERLNTIGKLYAIITRWVFSFNVLFYAGTIVLASNLLGLFGSEFKDAWPFLIILASGQLINGAVGGVETLLKMTENQDIVLIDNGIALFLNIVLNYTLIQAFGGLGAALSTAATFAFVNVLQFVQVYRRLGFVPFSRSYGKPCIAGGISTAVGFIITAHLPWVIVGFIIVGVYLGVLILLGIEPMDKKILQKLYSALFV